MYSSCRHHPSAFAAYDRLLPIKSAMVVGWQIFAEALNLLPGGVNSPVRAFKSVGGQPIIFDHVSGPYCFDVDGNKVQFLHAPAAHRSCTQQHRRAVQANL